MTNRPEAPAVDDQSLKSVRDWILHQDPDMCFHYGDTSSCMFAQYLRFLGWNEPIVGSDIAFDLTDAAVGSTEAFRFPEPWRQASMAMSRHPDGAKSYSAMSFRTALEIVDTVIFGQT